MKTSNSRTGILKIAVFVLAAAWLAGQKLAEFPPLASEDFESGRADLWRPDEPGGWRVAPRDGSLVYELTAPGKPGRIRAPASRSILDAPAVSAFDFRGRFQCEADPANAKRDLCVIFGYQDAEHFYYVHFSASSDDVHNIIGLVDGKDRVKINDEAPGRSIYRLTDRAWHAFRVTGDGAGHFAAYIDDLDRPILTAHSGVFRSGRVGVGSFDDTGAFDDLKLSGVRSRNLTFFP